MHLYKGSDWYDPKKLRELDVLVTLLDDFDLSRALSSRESAGLGDGVRPTLITVAWARNWFHRWLQQPWMGNYDLLLTSSSFAQDFYAEFGRRYGFPLKCIHSCPIEPAPILSCVEDDPHMKSEDNESNTRYISKVANGKAVSVLRGIFSVPEKTVSLSCTITTKKKNSLGDSLSMTARFRYLEHRKDIDYRLSMSNYIPINYQSRSVSRYRVQIPVKVLRIGTNIERFKKKGWRKLCFHSTCDNQLHIQYEFR